ncbi:MAG: lysophospholipid acyltransferase family protein [Woeseiaceae bacterium]|jgi:1-acyl-sn-glycerol-3-phosphate acyltransferase|nr:lysophospholipid acyltransferase family protein [Woeseiaceae bacterium]
MVWLRSLLFQLYFFVSVCVASLMIAIVFFLPFPRRFAIASYWGKSMLVVGRWLCGMQWEIEGEEHIPDVPSVIMIKHTTVFETYAQLAIFPPQTWVVKRELRWIPVFGWGLAAMNPIAIDRKAGSQAVRQVVDQGKNRLANGIWVTIFPEGTRMPLGETKRYGVSGALLAGEAQVPVLPVAHNAGDFWPRRGLKKEPGLIRICIGPPIEPGDLSPRDLNLKAQEWVEGKMREISVGYQNDR